MRRDEAPALAHTEIFYKNALERRFEGRRIARQREELSGSVGWAD